MPKYWGKQHFSLGSFPEGGQKQKTSKKEEDGLKVGNNNGQLCIENLTWGGARKAAWAKKPLYGKSKFIKNLFSDLL